ncbi:MAG: selenium-dependent molybdenum cofactor biosynthesis protein YqeB [Candidatus Pelethousia sp.]|nr:selenium-dependent molybdenum cofactor biosynthesis protein YqeB [Candidatus Pelethousia sp.]
MEQNRKCKQLVFIKGAGDLASGVALRLHRAGLRVVMTDLPVPTAIRRTVSFCPALTQGKAQVEDVVAKHARNREQVEAAWEAGEIPVLPDPEARSLVWLKPDVLVDAILAKANMGTAIDDAPIVIALGPGFTAGVDCHAVVETMRGHNLGRVYFCGSALPNTGIPGEIGGYAAERVMHAPAAGVFKGIRQIGDMVEAGETVALVGEEPVLAKINGVLRGVLADGIYAPKGMKCADVDPRCKREHCFSVSDKARSLGGAVLEAMGALGGF